MCCHVAVQAKGWFGSHAKVLLSKRQKAAELHNAVAGADVNADDVLDPAELEVYVWNMPSEECSRALTVCVGVAFSRRMKSKPELCSA